MRSTRPLWFGALALILGLAVLWLLAVIQLDQVAAAGLGGRRLFDPGISPDYSSGSDGPRFGSLRISVVSDMLRDLGFSSSESEDRMLGMMDGMEGAVPTATALNFEGDPPLTASPTLTPVPTKTPTAKPSATPTRFSTRKPTATLTETPKVVVPNKTATSSTCCDTQPPNLSGGSLSPPPSNLSVCQVTVSVSGLHVVDPAFSSGIQYTKLKFKVLGPGSQGYIYSNPLNKTSGGWTGNAGSTWDAYYDGSIVIDFDVGYTFHGSGKVMAMPISIDLSTTDTPTPTATVSATLVPSSTVTTMPTMTPTLTATSSGPSSFTVEVHAIAWDHAGHSGHILLGTYTMPGSCN